MITINLKDIYPSIYAQDTYYTVEDEVAMLLFRMEREEHAYMERRRVYKAYYSIDADDTLENKILCIIISPEQSYETQIDIRNLNDALHILSDKQSRRIYGHYFLGLSKTQIAIAERVDESTIRESIAKGLKKIKKYLKNFE